MNINEYKSHVTKHDHAMAWRLTLVISAVFLILGAAAALRWLNEQLANSLGPIIAFLVMFPSLVFGAWRIGQTYKRFPRLICPHCKCSIAKALQRLSRPAIVLIVDDES